VEEGKILKNKDLRKQIVELFVGFAGQENNLTIPRPFIALCQGDHLAALFLSQLLYWQPRSHDPDQWVVKNYNDWYKELALTETQVKRIVQGDKRNKNGGFHLGMIGVETQLKRSNIYGGAATLHYRVNMDTLSASILAMLGTHNAENDEASIAGNDDPSIAPNDDASIAQDVISETTTETTSEITDIDYISSVEAPESVDLERERLFSIARDWFHDVDKKRAELEIEYDRVGAEQFEAALNKSIGKDNIAYVLKVLRTPSKVNITTVRTPSPVSAAPLPHVEYAPTDNDLASLPYELKETASPAKYQRKEETLDLSPEYSAVWSRVRQQLEAQMTALQWMDAKKIRPLAVREIDGIDVWTMEHPEGNFYIQLSTRLMERLLTDLGPRPAAVTAVGEAMPEVMS
jgi:hypothetical protein